MATSAALHALRRCLRRKTGSQLSGQISAAMVERPPLLGCQANLCEPKFAFMDEHPRRGASVDPFLVRVPLIDDYRTRHSGKNSRLRKYASVEQCRCVSNCSLECSLDGDHARRQQ